MALEEVLDNYEQRFRNYLESVQQKLEDEELQDDCEEIIKTQNELLDILYDAVIYAHESDYTSHLSSEIKKTDQIVNELEELLD